MLQSPWLFWKEEKALAAPGEAQGRTQCLSWLAGDYPARAVGQVPWAVLSLDAYSSLLSFLSGFP